MSRVDVLTLPEQVPSQSGEWVPVVIDLLRATTTIVTAFYHGASGVFPVETVEEARELVEESGLLAGERGGLPPEGFDLGNSPLELIEHGVGGKRIWLTTSNGTRALKMANRYGLPLVVSLLNLGVTVNHLAQLGEPVLLICSGNSGILSEEDTFLAGAVVQHLTESKRGRFEFSARANQALELYRSGSGNLEEFLLQCPHAQKLVALGLDDDVRYAARVDACPILVEQRVDGWLGV